MVGARGLPTRSRGFLVKNASALVVKCNSQFRVGRIPMLNWKALVEKGRLHFLSVAAFAERGSLRDMKG
jgi:hypothetical protein